MKLIKQGMLAASCALLAALALPAQAIPVPYYINDNPFVGVNDYYMGADDQGYGDRIGDPDLYEISGMTVTRIGNTLTVSIDTTFADNVGSHPGTTPGPKGIGFGDLFLSDDWTPYTTGNAPYQFDDNTNGTLWKYGFSLDNRWNTSTDGSSLAGTLYNLNGATNNDNALLSDDFLNANATFRNGQEVAVDTASSNTTVVTGNNSSWSVDGPGLTVDFSIDLTGTIFENTDKRFALHWAMTCANDTIEGETPILPSAVPVPAAVWLFGSGLLGMVGVARRRKHS